MLVFLTTWDRELRTDRNRGGDSKGVDRNREGGQKHIRKGSEGQRERETEIQIRDLG